MATITTGLSGIAVYLPPYRVDLQSWCEWTGADWDKISQVVGTGFRLLGPRQSIYTMAANAVLRLIRQNDVDPGKVRYLGFSSHSVESAMVALDKYNFDSALFPIIQHLRLAAKFESEDDDARRLDKLEAIFPPKNKDDTRAKLIASLLSLNFEDRYGSLDLSAAQVKQQTFFVLRDVFFTLAQIGGKTDEHGNVAGFVKGAK